MLRKFSLLVSTFIMVVLRTACGSEISTKKNEFIILN